jgi:hypothetical protein
MLNIKESVGHVIAADTQATVKAIDQSVAQQTRLIANVIDAAHDSNMPMIATQELLEEMAKGLSAVVDGRGHVASAVKQIVHIQANSTLRETAFGCPNGFYLRAEAEAVKAIVNT